MSGLSIHAVDIVGGCPAEGLSMDLFRLDNGERTPLLQDAKLDAEGKILVPYVDKGKYEAVFRVSGYFESLPQECDGFLSVVTYPFGISDPERHHHLPLKFTEFGFSMFLTH